MQNFTVITCNYMWHIELTWTRVEMSQQQKVHRSPLTLCQIWGSYLQASSMKQLHLVIIIHHLFHEKLNSSHQPNLETNKQSLQWLTGSGGALWGRAAVQTHHVGSCRPGSGSSGVSFDCWTSTVCSYETCSRGGAGSMRLSSDQVWRWPGLRLSLVIWQIKTL